MSGFPEWYFRQIQTGFRPVPKGDDLNNLWIENHNTPQGDPVLLGSVRHDADATVRVQVFFTSLEEHLVREINAAQAVVGCMAWLTNPAILRALAAKELVSILVQKEDFLRPDGQRWSKKNLHQLYSALPASCERWEAGVGYSFCCDPSLAPIRCVGVARKGSAVPRMHHKFMVFCKVGDGNSDTDDPSSPHGSGLVPYRVWTGSFNATDNGVKSLENAVVIHDEKIARAYLSEYRTLFGISEPLAWETDWVQPEYRIGS